MLREVIKRLAACQLHGNLTPGRFSAGCSHCLRRLTHKKRFNARTVTEQEYHCPYCLSSPYREPPDTDSRLFIAPCRKGKPKTKNKFGEISLPIFPQIVAQPLMWLMLITIAIGMCLMNGYSVVKGHAHSPHKEENRQRVFRTSPPVSSFNDDCSTTYFKNFFQSFFIYSSFSWIST